MPDVEILFAAVVVFLRLQPQAVAAGGSIRRPAGEPAVSFSENGALTPESQGGILLVMNWY